MIKYFKRLIQGVSIGGQEDLARSINNVFDILENLEGAPYSGIKITRTGNMWRIGYDGSVESGSGSGDASVLPRTFDLVAGTSGKLKLLRCYYQISGTFVFSSSQPEFTPTGGTLYAVIDTSVAEGEVTAVMNFVYDPNVPEKFPIGLYILDETGAVVCDLRGSQVVIYG